MATGTVHPRDALFEPGERAPADIPVCDHVAGSEEFMRKALEMQLEMGPVFDVTLDHEDGAPVGGEAEHAHMIRELLASPLDGFGRVAVRVLPVEHPKFDEVLRIVLGGTRKPCHVMLPKALGAGSVDRAAEALDAAGGAGVPLHALAAPPAAEAVGQAADRRDQQAREQPAGQPEHRRQHERDAADLVARALRGVVHPDREAILNNAPEGDGDFFKVPQILNVEE